MGKYYITNGIQYIGKNGDIVETPKLAQRFTYSAAQSYLAKVLKNNSAWAFRKYFLSGGRYVITTSTLYATANGNVTKDINTAKEFKSPADAVNYIKNNRTITGYIPDPIIVDSAREFVSRPEIKQFTPEQLAVLGAVKPTPRIKIGKKERMAIAKKTGDICPICGYPIVGDEYTLDHTIPLSRGGDNSEENLRMVHPWCNKFKNNYLDDEMFDLTSKIERKRIFENPHSEEAVFMMRAYLRGVINEWKKEGVV